jgi:hypothetical protein
LILFALGKKKRKEIIPLFIDIKRLRSRINQEYDVILQKEGSAIEQAPLPQHRHLHPKCFSPIHNDARMLQLRHHFQTLKAWQGSL